MMPREKEKPLSENEYKKAEGIDEKTHKQRKEGIYVRYTTDLKKLGEKAREELPILDKDGRTADEAYKARYAALEENEKKKSDKRIESNLPERQKCQEAERIYKDAVERLNIFADESNDLKNKKADMMRVIEAEIKHGTMTDAELIDFYDRAVLKINEFIETNQPKENK